LITEIVNINDFGSIFEIFAALNLGYAGSSVFRSAVDNSILEIKKDIISLDLRNKITQIKSELLILCDTETENISIQKKFDSLTHTYSVKTRAINISSGKYSDFPKGIKSIFLVSFLLSLTILVIGGYERHYNSTHFNTILAFLNLTVITNIILFIRNIYPKYRTSNVKTIYLFIFYSIPVFLFLIYSYLLSKNWISEIYIPEFRLNILLAIIFSFSSFILHFIRVLINKKIVRFQIYWLNLKARIIMKRYSYSLVLYKGFMNRIFKL
jgi:hypothetical protein